LGGALQVIGGAAVFIQVEVPVAAQVAGGIAVVHGASDWQTGFRQMLSGREERSAIEQGVTAVARSAHVEQHRAEALGTAVDTALGFVNPAGPITGAPRLAAAITSTGHILPTVVETTPRLAQAIQGVRVASTVTHGATTIHMMSSHSGGGSDDSRPPGSSTGGDPSPQPSQPSGSEPPSQPSRPTPPTPPRGIAAAARLINESATGERYYVRDSSNPRFYAEGTVTRRGELSIAIRAELESGARSTLIRGQEQFERILGFFHGQFTSIKGNWQFGTNLAKINELTSGGMSIEQAAAKTWTGERAAAAGYSRVTVVGAEGAAGHYTSVQVLFHH
jgi:hypothetical protein